MPLYVNCPYYMKDTERTIYCEGCSHFWWTKEKMQNHLKRFCVKNYKKCKYYKELTKQYEDIEQLPTDKAKTQLYKFYYEHQKTETKKLKGMLTKTEQIAGKNIAIKQHEIDNCHDLIRQARTKANETISEKVELILALMAIMSITDTQEVDFAELIETAKEKDLQFEITEKGIKMKNEV